MSPIFPSLPADLGVYTLTQLLESHETRDRYIARQSHVERSVVIEVLRPDCSQEILDSFLRSARVRVAARLPQVSQVLETMVSGNIWYITLECPEGIPLSRFREEGRHLSTLQACAVIQKAAELYDHCFQKNLAAEALTADAVFVSEAGDVTFLSPLMAGQPTPELHGQQLDGLAAILQEISPEGEAGQTRVATLMDWLGQEFDGQRMDWSYVSTTAAYIKENVQAPSSKEKSRPRTAETAYARKRRRIRRIRLILKYWPLILRSLALAVGVSLLGFLVAPFIPVDSLPAVQDNCVYCRVNSGKVAVMRSSVSIGEYKEFLDDFKNMTGKRRSAVHKGIPNDVTDHTPAEWTQQLQAAEKNASWNGQSLNLQSPVRGVSYWDALAYANYRNASLPSADLLHTVRKATIDSPCEEWTSTPFPGNVVYTASTIVLPANHASTPIPESDLSRKDTGRSFRIILPATPQ